MKRKGQICAIIISLAVLTLWIQTATAGVLSGKISLTKEFVAELTEKNDEKALEYSYWNEPNGMLDVRSVGVNFNNDVYVLLDKPGAEKPGPGKIVEVKVHAGRLEKNLLVVRPGTTVRFINKGTYSHKLYVPDISIFKPEIQAKGGMRQVEFAKEGLFEIRCKLFPHFKGFILVTSASHVIKVSRDGSFEIDDLENGNYNLKIHFLDKLIYEKSVEISEKNKKKLELKISIKSLNFKKSDKKDTKKKKEGN